jgi:hypothetical protein
MSGQDWRGGQAPRGGGRQEESLPKWRQARSSTAKRTKGFRPSLRMVGGIAFLIALVGLVIWFMRPAKPVHTHFVVMNLLNDARDFDVSPGFEVPEPLTVNSGIRTVTISQPETLTLANQDPGTDDGLKRADCVVIFLQSVFVPASDGDFRCLIRNSTPALADDNQSVLLSDLRKQLSELSASRPHVSLLLMVESLSTPSEWRMGHADVSPDPTFEQWTVEIPELTIVRVCGNRLSGVRSVQTPFARLAAAGFSSIANADADTQLTIREYCQFVSDEFPLWARDNSLTDVSLQIFPDPEKSVSSQRDAILFSDVIPGTKALTRMILAPQQEFRNLEALWTRCDVLRSRGAVLWFPAQWTAVIERLKRTEAALLSGLTETAQRQESLCERDLKDLETVVAAICPDADSFHGERGLCMSLFQNLPSRERVASLFPELTSNPRTIKDPLVAVEGIVALQRKQFPFGELGLSGPSADLDSHLTTTRLAAEIAFAEMFRVAARIPQTTRRMESQLLELEDAAFINPADQSIPQLTAARLDATDDTIRRLREFCEAYDRAEVTSARIAGTLPGMLQWAGHCPQAIPQADQDLWIQILKSAADSMAVSKDTVSLLLDPLSRLQRKSADAVYEYEKAELDLRREVHSLTVYTRGLQQALSFIEPESGFSQEQLTQATADLNEWLTSANRSARRIDELAHQLCRSAASDQPNDRNEQLALREILNSALWMTDIPPRQRVSVLRRIQEWDRKLTEISADAKPEESATSRWNLLSPRQSSLWMVQQMRLIPTTDEMLTSANAAIESTGSLQASVGVVNHASAAKLGGAIRDFWQSASNSVETGHADSSVNALTSARNADLQLRWLPSFEVQRPIVTSVSSRHREFQKFEYCRMHVDRILAGQWVHPEDRDPYAQNGWYAKAASKWLEATKAPLNRAPAVGGDLTQPMKNSLSEALTRLAASDQLAMKLSATSSRIDLGEQSRDKGQVAASYAVFGAGSSGLAGTAAAFLRLPDTSPIAVPANLTPFALKDSEGSIPLVIRRQGLPGGRDCSPLTLKTEAFFRGRFFRSPDGFEVNTCAPAEFVVEVPAAPPNASIEVIGRELRPVVLVLDFSSSMTEVLTETQTQRYKVALNTLQELISTPELQGSRVILWVYGHRVTLRDGKNVPNPAYEAAFNKEIPNGIDAMSDFEVEFDGTIRDRESQDDFVRVLSRLEQSQPWGITPLFESITKSISSTLGQKPGIVIAITDGQPSSASPGDLLNKQQRLKDTISNNPRASITLVAFDLIANPAQNDILKKTFAAFPSIQIEDATQKDQLLTKLNSALDPDEFSVIWPDPGGQRSSDLGTRISSLPPRSDYHVQFDQIRTEQPLTLRDGDSVLLEIDRSLRESRFLFRRAASSLASIASLPEKSSQDAPTMLRFLPPVRFTDIPTLAASQRARAEMTVMLDHNRMDLPVTQPAEFELRVRPDGADTAFQPPSMKVAFTSLHHAPAWDLLLEEWPRKQPFLIDAVWKMDRTTPEKIAAWADIRNALSPETAMSIGGNGLPECGAWVTLRDGELQVRLDPAPGRPVANTTLTLPEELGRNDVDDVRVELGQRDTLGQNQNFRPWRLSSRIVRLENGSVSWQFSGPELILDALNNAEFAFTSAAARRVDASVVQDFRIAP